jgi:hypothetical protein
MFCYDFGLWFWLLLQDHFNMGQPIYECEKCGAQMWYQERCNKSRHSINPTFQMCCSKGKVLIPYLDKPPLYLQHLLFDTQPIDSKNYQKHTRVYNTMFAFTSPGMTLDSNFGGGNGPPTIRLQGQACHRIGTLLPLPGDAPKFAQLYIYDTENEVANRIEGVG